MTAVTREHPRKSVLPPSGPHYLLHTSIAPIQNGDPQLQSLNHHGAHLTCHGEDSIESPRKQRQIMPVGLYQDSLIMASCHSVISLGQLQRTVPQSQKSPLLALIIWRTISAAPRSCKRACWYRVFCFSISFSWGEKNREGFVYPQGIQC